MALVVFYDGECGLCSSGVRILGRLDRHGVIEYAPLQGKFSREMGLKDYANKVSGTMVLLREETGEMFYKSDAWVHIARELGGWCGFAGRFLGCLPRSLRDGIYDMIARNRYRLGEKVVCEIPDEGLRRRIRE